MKTLLIVNPIAGRGYALKALPRIRDYLHGDGVEHEVVYTEGHLHAVELARDALSKGYEHLVTVGGDGTSNEVLNGMMAAGGSGPAGMLSVLPVGSGNDFAYGIGMPMDLREACRSVAEGKIRLLDVGQVGDHYFGNGVGVGFDTIVGLVATKHKRLRGLPLYLLAVLETIMFYFRAPLINVQADGKDFAAPLIMISVTIGQRMGGGFFVTPDAIADDGLFDLMFAREMSRMRMLAMVPKFIKGTHVHEREITMGRAQRVVLSSEGDLAAHTDGELLCEHAHHLEFTLHPKAMRVKT